MSVPDKAMPDKRVDHSAPGPTRRIAILGLYGQLNLGNECTLEALIANLNRKESGVSLTAVCSEPTDVRERHGIDAVPFLSNPSGKGDTGRPVGVFFKILRPFRILFRRIPEEFRGLSRAMTTMRQKDMLLIGGTGILEDNIGWSLNWIWSLAKWVLAAKRSGAAVAFVSIGAGPIQRPFDRWIIKRMLGSADFVSYRDDYSIDYMYSIGVETTRHFPFPDLAFGLPIESRVESNDVRETVAVGVMEYVGQRRSRSLKDGAYETYVNNLAGFMRNLMDQDFDVNLLYGDARYDQRVVTDLKRELREYSDSGQLKEAEIASVNDVVRELAGCRFVVASRFHNLIISLILGKPTISISYHDKNDALLEMFDLGDYCHDIDFFDSNLLVEQFENLVRKEDELQSHILATADRLRTEVDRQYDLFLNLSTEEAARQGAA